MGRLQTNLLDLSGPTGQLAESSRVHGQLMSARTPDEVRSFAGGALAAGHTSALAFNQALQSAIDTGYRDITDYYQTQGEAVGRGYEDAGRRLTERNARTAGGYGDALNYLGGQNSGISGGYGDLSRDVLAGIEGIGRTAAQDIDARYQQSYARQQQNLISSGLGNSTVGAAGNRVMETDRGRALGSLAEQMAGLRAGYRSQLGQAGLGFRERAIGAETDQRNRGLGFDERSTQAQAQQSQMGLAAQERFAGGTADLGRARMNYLNTISAPYPNAGMYAAMVQQAGAADQANADRAQIDRQGLGLQQIAAGAGRDGGAGGAGIGAPMFGGGAARGTSWNPPARGNYGANPGYDMPGAGGGYSAGRVGPPALVGAGGGGYGGAMGQFSAQDTTPYYASGAGQLGAGETADYGYGGAAVAGGYGGYGGDMGFGTQSSADQFGGSGSGYSDFYTDQFGDYAGGSWD